VARDPTLAAGLQSASYLTGAPGAAEVLNSLSSDPNVHSNFNVSGEGDGPASEMLGLVVLGGVLQQRVGPSFDYGSSGDLIVNAGALGSAQRLLLGFEQAQFTGAGFDSLTFTVHRGNTLVANQTFDDLNTALTYFDDQMIDLGPISGSGSFELNMSFDLVTSKLNSSLDIQAIAGDATPGAGPDVPEPRALVLLTAGLSLLMPRNRRAATT